MGETMTPTEQAKTWLDKHLIQPIGNEEYKIISALYAENERLRETLETICHRLDKGKHLEERMGEHTCKTLAREALEKP